MKKVAFLAIVAVFGLMATAQAQTNASHMLLDSPYKVEGETHNAGETVICTVTLPSTSEFEMDQFLGTSPVQFIVDDLFAPFTIYQWNELCTLLTTWTTGGFPGGTMTGLTIQEPSQLTYWTIDVSGGVIDDYVMFSGIGGPAAPVGLPAGWTVPGPLALDNNQGSAIAYAQDIALDLFQEINLVTGALGCTFINPDNAAGSGAYGNGMSEAAIPADCGGTTLTVASGSIAEGQVTRASQTDCTGTLCYTSWDLATPTNPTGEFFINGIEEFLETGSGSFNKHIMAMGNVTGIVFNITKVVGIGNCQGADSPDSDVLYVNALQGGATLTVGIDNTLPIGMAIQKPPAGGPGKFITTLNPGIPSASTITPLPAQLGVYCHPLLIPPFGSAAPLCIWNNIGKTNKVGASNYFGTTVANPAKAPTYMNSSIAGDPYIVGGDPGNFVLGQQYTYQGIIFNPTSSSPKGASVTNAMIVDVTAGL